MLNLKFEVVLHVVLKQILKLIFFHGFEIKFVYLN